VALLGSNKGMIISRNFKDFLVSRTFECHKKPENPPTFQDIQETARTL